MGSHIKAGIQAKGICKQGPDENIWAQERNEWGIANDSRGTS